MKVTIVELDGYENWTPTEAKTVELEGDFTPKSCHKLYCEVNNIHKQDQGKTLKYVIGGDKVVVKGNTITCNGEENGVMFIAHI